MPPSPLRRTLSAPVVRANAAPYPSASPSPRRSARHLRRRVLADMDWWTVMDGQGHQQPLSRDGEENVVPAAQVVPLAEEMAVEPQEMVLNLPSGEQVLQPERLAYDFAGLSLAPALSLAPQTPTRRRTRRREVSLSPSVSDISSTPGSPMLGLVPLPAPDFGSPANTPRRTRRTRALQRVNSEPVIPRAVGSRRRNIERTHSMVSRSSSRDENAPIVVPDLFN